MNCNVAAVWMHDYLDNELPRADIVELKKHLLACPDCRKRYKQLEQTEAFAAAALQDNPPESPEAAYDAAALRARIMNGLPKGGARRTWTRWVRRHPAVTAAAVFAVVMLSSFLTMWEQDGELIVRGSDLEHVVIAGNKVVVPEGAEVKGNLTVENGRAEVYGKVNGNLTVIDGSMNLASTALIAGEERTINQALDWIWYKVTSTVSELAS